MRFRNMKKMVDVDSAMDHFDAAVEPHVRYCYNSRHCQYTAMMSLIIIIINGSDNYIDNNNEKYGFLFRHFLYE